MHIIGIEITNRINTRKELKYAKREAEYFERLRDFDVTVIDSMGTPVFTQHIQAAAAKHHLNSVNRLGRVVRVQLRGKNVLHMQDVKVFGHPYGTVLAVPQAAPVQTITTEVRTTHQQPRAPPPQGGGLMGALVGAAAGMAIGSAINNAHAHAHVHGGAHAHGGRGGGGAHGSLQVGRKYHFEGGKSGKMMAVMPDGKVHGHGGRGKHATWTVEANRGAVQFKNDSGSYLACQDGRMKKGGGGKWCDFHVRDHAGHILIRSAHGDFGVGFEPNGEVRDSSHVKEGHMYGFRCFWFN